MEAEPTAVDRRQVAAVLAHRQIHSESARRYGDVTALKDVGDRQNPSKESRGDANALTPHRGGERLIGHAARRPIG